MRISIIIGVLIVMVVSGSFAMEGGLQSPSEFFQGRIYLLEYGISPAESFVALPLEISVRVLNDKGVVVEDIAKRAGVSREERPVRLNISGTNVKMQANLSVIKMNGEYVLLTNMKIFVENKTKEEITVRTFRRSLPVKRGTTVEIYPLGDTNDTNSARTLFSDFISRMGRELENLLSQDVSSSDSPKTTDYTLVLKIDIGN